MPRPIAPPGLPADDPLRRVLHDEVHARPSPLVGLPALVTYVAVLNDGVTRDAEGAHLRRLPGQAGLAVDALQANFLRLALGENSLKWERHSEFTRYSIVQPLPAAGAIVQPLPAAGAIVQPLPAAGAIVQPLPAASALDALLPGAMAAPAVDAAWLAGIPGRTVAAIQLVMLVGELGDGQAVLAAARRWFGQAALVGSRMGAAGRDGPSPHGHSCAITDFQLRDDGFERLLVVAQAGTTDSRAGRIAQRLLEIETYRLMALRGLPVAKALAPMLADAEAELAAITARLEGEQVSEQDLLHTLIALAARIERATAEQMYRFSATQAYDALVRQRIGELRETPISGAQTIGEFMQRRLSPAMATVAATAQRLSALSQRIERASALLRTRVDIATEAQNQQLLAKLTRGQELQLRLQSTVEGLSIAAISYYVVSLLLYGGKAAKAAGLPIDPELAAGAMIPLVLWAVWTATRRIHRRLRSVD